MYFNKELFTELTSTASQFGLDGYNNSHYFLLPLFGVKQPLLYDSNYVGSYVGDDKRISSMDSVLHVVFKFMKSEEKLLKKVTNSFNSERGFVYSYHAGSDKHYDYICFVLKCDSEYLEDFENIVLGNYSKVSRKYLTNKLTTYPFSGRSKKRMLDICTKNPEHIKVLSSLAGQSLDASEELWFGFEPELEIYRYGEK